MNGEPFRGFESHPLRHKRFAVFDCRFSIWFLFTSCRNAHLESLLKVTEKKYLHRIVGLTIILGTLSLSIGDSVAQRRRPTRHAAICGNPKITCKTSASFQLNDLPFEVGKNSVIVDTVPFYAIILKSVAVKEDNCDVFISERDRLSAQTLFPDHKVFSSRCTDPENLFYADASSRTPRYFSETHRIMAVYAGTTPADANRMLEAVKATGKFPGANIRRMRTGFNGT